MTRRAQPLARTYARDVELGRSVPLDRLLARAPTAAVFMPRGEAAFGEDLVCRLRVRGFATYELKMGPTLGDVLHAARATPPDTAVVYVHYVPGAYHLSALVAGVLRWKGQGCFVVLCRGGAFASPRQHLAYAALRLLVDLELPAADAGVALAAWSPRRVPRPSWLARAWRPRSGSARLEELIPLLCCPTCRSDLRAEPDALRCNGCGQRHPIVDGIPVLLPPGAIAQVEQNEDAYAAGDAYNVGADENRAWLEIGLYKRDLVARLLHRRVPRASIDVGCGDWGLHQDVFAAVGTQLAVAGDVSLKLVRHARDHASAPLRVHHLVFSAEALPFRADVFDLAYCSEVLEHLEHPDRALAEMARVAGGGRSILTVPNEQLVGKLETGHVQTFGFDDFLTLVRGHVDVARTWGVFLWRAPDVNALARTLGGTLRLKLYLKLGESAPRRSLSILTDGTLRRVDHESE